MSFNASKQRWSTLPRRTAALAVFTTIMLALLGLYPALQATEARCKQVWAEADAASNVWLDYSDTAFAPFGDMQQDGFRLRVVGAPGCHSYHSTSDTVELNRFATGLSAGGALIGYLLRLDPLILKLFVSAAFSNHLIRPIDRHNRVQGPDAVIKMVAEFWYNIVDYGFASLNVAWSQAHQTRSVGARIGYKVMPHLSVGTEAGLNLDRQAAYKIYRAEGLDYFTEPIDYGRIGAITRYDCYCGELSAPAGFVGDFREERSAYRTLN